MKRLWRKIIRGERGQALPIVLAVMIIGGLMIAPALNHISTSLNAGRMVEENVKGVYAAEAGVEDVLWLLTEGIDEPPEEPQLLPENINQMEVEVETEDKGTYALYSGDIIVVGEPPQVNYDRLAVDGEWGEWDEEKEAYEYTITVTWQPGPGAPDILLNDIGVRLPVGYSYVEYSAADFSEYNLFDDDEPDDVDVLDWAGAQMLSWELEPPYPEPRPMVTIDNQTATQTFYVTGEGGREGDYTWVKSGVASVGEVSEVIGTLYSITATATHPDGGETTTVAVVMADVIVKEIEGETEAEVRIIRWQINPQ